MWKLTSLPQEKKCESQYKFINPQPGCEITEEENLKQIRSIETELIKQIDSFVKTNQASNVSVFFRELTTRRFIGINQNEKFNPASLYKLPILIAYYKFTELQPDILNEKFIYQGRKNTQYDLQNIKPSVQLIPGRTYTINNLIRQMIIYSDNEAADMLHSYINPDFLKKVLADFGVSLPISPEEEIDFMSTRTQADMLRSLYNSSYLSRENSNKALKLLSEVEFSDGLVAGVPEKIVIAHKFGERSIVVEGNKVTSVQLHDCGIIYKPNDPYILCIMTRGADFDSLTKVIQKISSTVFNNIPPPPIIRSIRSN